MLPSVLALIAAARVFFRSGTDIAIEVLALRQQLAVLKRKRPKPPLCPLDRLFWTVLRATWSRWKDALLVVKPETVVGWHRAGFQLYWRWKSRPCGGRPRITEEVRVLIRRLAQENSDWGAPKIHGELQKLGFVLSERTVARYLRRIQRRGDPAKNGWRFFATTARPSLPSTSSPCRPQRSVCCTVSSSSSTDAAGFYISTLLDIRVRNGSFNNCARLLRKLARTVT